jgi:molybdopterin synthase catalytic subunit
MRIRLRYFAILRERAGCDAEDVDVPDTCSAMQAFRQRFPDIDIRVGFARNAEICAPGTALQAGDELALLPPLGGG